MNKKTKETRNMLETTDFEKIGKTIKQLYQSDSDSFTAFLEPDTTKHVVSPVRKKFLEQAKNLLKTDDFEKIGKTIKTIYQLDPHSFIIFLDPNISGSRPICPCDQNKEEGYGLA